MDLVTKSIFWSGLSLLHPLLLVLSGSYPVAILGLGRTVPLVPRLGTAAAILAAVLALAILALAAVHVAGVGRSGLGLAMRVTGGAGFLLLAGVFLRHRLLRPLRLLGRPWEVVANLPEQGGARTLRVRPAGHPG